MSFPSDSTCCARCRPPWSGAVFLCGLRGSRHILPLSYTHNTRVLSRGGRTGRAVRIVPKGDFCRSQFRVSASPKCMGHKHLYLTTTMQRIQ